MGQLEQLAAFLREHGYEDTFWHSKFWDISEEAAEKLLSRAENTSVPEKMREQLESLKNREAVDIPTAVQDYRDGKRPKNLSKGSLRQRVFHGLSNGWILTLVVLGLLVWPLGIIMAIYFLIGYIDYKATGSNT